MSAAPVTVDNRPDLRSSLAALPNRLWNSSWRVAIISTAVSALLAWGFLLLPPQNTDMAAQLARADFAWHYPTSIIDFRWFGGTVGYGYTLWAAALMALIGTKVTGAIAAIIGTWYATRMLQRLNPAHPLLGGLAAGLTQVANVVEGRITFACGLTCGLIALTLFTTVRVPRWVATMLAAFFSLLCGGASPVAAILLWICGGTAALMRRYAAAAALMVPSGIAAGMISIVFGDGGRQPFSFADALRSTVVLVLVLLVVPKRCIPIRIGAALGIAMVVAAFALPTPVGSNSTRLSLLFALPIAAAFVHWRNRVLNAALLVAIFALELPVSPGTIASTGKDSGFSSYYRPVSSAVYAQGQLTGRVEVPDMAGHWDAVYLARSVPLARGWLRQTDVRLNDAVFYKQKPTVSTYGTFLHDNAVQYVAVPDADLTSFGKSERELIAHGLPYLHLVWTNAHWKLYEVLGFTAIVDAPSEVVKMTPSAVVVKVPAGMTATVRLRWYPWLGLESRDKRSCIRPDGRYTELQTVEGGNYTFNSRFTEGTGHCPQ